MIATRTESTIVKERTTQTERRKLDKNWDLMSCEDVRRVAVPKRCQIVNGMSKK
jgi:hypothetical protein